ncbi:hypothetical protein [Rubripirellula amarantea]|uniref:hypothetical protein n=1 Tax=Rubripirellula amarantea TaxID=2527999 RepID=UPI0036F248F9
MTLFNNLSEKIVFDDVGTSCTCQQIEPKNGVIPVGGKLTFTLKLNGVDRPRETKMLGFLRFIKQGREVVSARFSCNYSAYYVLRFSRICDCSALPRGNGQATQV